MTLTATTERPFAPTVAWPRPDAMALAESAHPRRADLLGDLEAAVEFCRIISGRSTGTGLLTTEVSF